MYTKVIQSGNLIEIYTYEKDPPEFRPRKKSRFKNTRRYRRNVERARVSFFRLVRANLGPTRVPAFITLTMRDVVSLGEGWKAFTRFAARLKYRTKGRVSLIAVPEFQKRGAVHFHCLAWGLTHEEIIGERTTRTFAQLWGHGFIDIRPSDGSPKLAGYLAKYMSKALYDERLSGKKSYSASRSLMRSVPLKSKTAVAIIEREIAGDRLQPDGSFLVGVDIPLLPEKEKRYTTRWMGECNYKVYIFPEGYAKD